MGLQGKSEHQYLSGAAKNGALLALRLLRLEPL